MSRSSPTAPRPRARSARPTDRTFCRICEVACGLVVERDASGTPVRLRPDRDDPTSAGFICAKGAGFLDVARHPDRLLHPARRRPDGSLERLSWPDAIGHVAGKLRAILDAHGPDAVGLYYGNPIAFNALGAVATMALARALGTRNVYSAVSQDCANKFAGAEIVHGSPFIHPIADLERADLAILLGTNPAVSQSSFLRLQGGARVFDRMIARGADVVWVDPRRTESARRWGTHLVLRPGTDAWLLLALVGLLADRAAPDPRVEGLGRLVEAALAVTPARAAAATGVAEADIRDLADRIRRTRRVALHMSVGVNQGPFGTLSYVALHALAYLAGSLDAPGGLLFHPLAIRTAEMLRRLGIGTGTRRSRVGAFRSTLDALPGGVLADEILEPGEGQIRALLVIAGDPVASIPGEPKLRRALERLDLLACVDLFENATGRAAHVLLPATTWLERWDVSTTAAFLQTSPVVPVSGPVCDPPGEARPEWHILTDLLGALGRPRWASALSRVPIDRILPRPAWGWRAPRPEAGTYLGRGPRTTGRRLRFWSDRIAHEVARLERSAAPPASGTFLLVGRRRRLDHNAWLRGGGRDGDGEARAWMAPGDLAAMGLPGGGPVEVRSDAGAIAVEAVPEDGVAPGTLVLPHGLPGASANAVLPSGPDAIERASGQHVMTGVAVRVTKGARTG